MMQLSSPVVPFGWAGCWEEENIMMSMYNNSNSNSSKTETTSDSLVLIQPSAAAAISSGGDHMAKKLNHNASERDRRKKINNLYSSLRSLLPSSHQLKKSSIPTTVSRVVKYIPELQQEVDTLIRMKQELISKMNTRQGEEMKKHGRNRNRVSSSTVSANKVGDSDNEVVVQICTVKKVQTTALSHLFLNLQKDGLNVVNVSSFESFGGNLFYNIHLQTEGFQKIECDMVTEKLLSFIV